MNEERKQILCKCNHCGNKGYLDVAGHFTNHNIDYCDGEPCYWWDNDWFLLKCPVCGDAVLYEECTEEGDVKPAKGGHYEYVVDAKLLYPNPFLILKSTPSDIKTAYESAVQCLNVDKRVSLIAFRLVLEKMAKDKNAKGTKLVDMINDLARKKVLPPVLKESGSIVRLLGNLGAHGVGDVYVTKNDLLVIKQFVEYMLDYIYEMPVKIENLTKKFKLENKLSSSANEPIQKESDGEKNV